MRQDRTQARRPAQRQPVRPGLAAAVVATATLAAACSDKTGVAGSRLFVGLANDAINLDPARANDNESIEVSDQIYARLVRFGAGLGEPEPDLAKGWRVSEDGMTWTFDLRPDVTFHDGTPVDAAAVVFSFERQIDPRHPFHGPGFEWLAAYRNIRKVTAVGPLRVQFEIEKPYAPFLANLAMAPAAIVSPTAVRRWGGDLGKHPVGAGPFRFVEWVPGDRITLERNPTYWDSPARIQHLIFLALPEAGRRLQALESGSIDVMLHLPPDDMPFVRLHPELRFSTVTAASIAYLALNNDSPTFADVRMRRAVAHAIRREALVKLIYQGLAVPASGPLPPSLWGSRNDQVAYSYDVDRARQLLSEAGYKRNPARPLKLYAPSVPRIYLPAPERFAEIIKANLAEIGIPVEIVFADITTLKRALQKGEHDMALFGWVGDNGDPDNFLYTLLDRDNAVGDGAQNIAFYRSERFHTLIMNAQRTTVRAEREHLYSEAQDVLAVDSPWVPLAHTKLAIATRATVRHLTVRPTSLPIYRLAEVAPR